MIVDELLDDVRLVVNDSADETENAKQTYSDGDVIRAATRQVQSLVRIQVEKTRGFHNATICLQTSRARQIYPNCWQYPIPSWVSSIVSVYERSAGADSETAITPYVWSTANRIIQIARKIEPWRRDSEGVVGYHWDGNRTLRIYGIAQAVPLALDIAKLPAPLMRVTIANAHGEADKLWIPDEPELGAISIEEGALVNAELQVTTAANSANYGQLRRVVYSTSNDVSATARRNLVYLESPLTAALSQNDVVQSMLPFGTEHSRVVTLMTANALFEKTANLLAQRAIAEELRMELANFARFADRKDYDGPEFIRPRHRVGISRVDDRARSFGAL